MARLVVSSPQGESTVELEAGEVVTIGRDPANALALPDEPKASRRHCRVSPREGGRGGWEVADLGSTNKTRVNGAAVTERGLSHGDTIEIGDVSIRFEDPEEADRLARLEAEGVCYLEHANPDRKGEKVLLQEKKTTFGRRESNTVVLDDRMASGHHCEIVRDINGYTIRDLGSTNGTLVNGEPISETVLTHGARVRVGNARFVFKDPSMKDIEVELAQFEEDEGWGMMGEIDLSRARGSWAGVLAILVLFLAAGAGVWFISQRPATQGTAAAAFGGLVDNGDFERDDLQWSAQDEGAASVRIQSRGGRSGGALVASHAGEAEAGPALVTYAGLLETAGTQPLRIRAALRGEAAEDGEQAELLLVWRSEPSAEERAAGASNVERRATFLVAGDGWEARDLEVVPPTWADVLLLGLWLPPGSRATLDDVSVERGSGRPAAAGIDLPGFRNVVADGMGYADLLGAQRVILASGHPVASMADGSVQRRFLAERVAVEGDLVVEGRFLDGGAAATMRWTPTAEGATVTLACDTADRVGLALSGFPQRLGVGVNVLGDFPPQRLSTAAGQRLEGVGRTLAAEGDDLVAITAVDEKPELALVIEAGRAPGEILVEHWLPGGEGRLQLLTDFAGERQRAREELMAARALAASEPGRAMDELRRVAQAYPFEEAIRDEAVKMASRLDEEARQEIRGLEEALADFEIYTSPDALAVVEERAQRLASRFLASGEPSSALEVEIAALVDRAAAARTAFEVRQAVAELDRLGRMVGLLERMEDYRPMAAIFARALVDRYGDLADASPDVARRVDAARQQLATLLEDEAVRQAVPPRPE